MNENEVQDFFALLDQACEAVGKPAKSMDAKMMFLDILGGYGYKNLRGAIMAHLRDPERGRFPPTPADLKAQIDKAMQNDGRPTADEAWAIAVQLDDEYATVVSTDEISGAWGAARDIMPDRVGARMAFRSAYERLCSEARANGQAVRWFPSLGRDALAREGVLKQAVQLGRLQYQQIENLLPAPAPKQEVVALIGSTVAGDKKKAEQALSELKKKLGVK
jgi:hypothetical protein